MNQFAARRNGSAIAPNGPILLLARSNPNGMPWLTGQASAEGRLRRGIVHGAEITAEGRRDWKGRPLRRLNRHLPSVDQVDVVIAIRHREPDGPFPRLMLAEMEISDTTVVSPPNAVEFASGVHRRVGCEAPLHVLFEHFGRHLAKLGL